MADERNHFPQNPSPTPPPPPSRAESLCYYAYLPSRPRLVARTGTNPWRERTGRDAWNNEPRELRTIGDHPIAEVWEDDLAVNVYSLLDSMEVKWTSIDVVRIRYPEDPEESPVPPILWIGVEPLSLSGDDGVVVAFKCLGLLRERSLDDIEVEIRESRITHSAGPKLPSAPSPYDTAVSIHRPLTATLGFPIGAQSVPLAEGTGGFFITEGGETKRFLLVTTRRATFTTGEDCNKPFEDGGRHLYDIVHFGDAASDRHPEPTPDAIEDGEIAARYQESADVKSTFWSAPENRVLGHVVLSPPIGVGSEGYTEDWAVIEVDPSNVNASNFKGNAIDLGNDRSFGEFMGIMFPNPRGPKSFDYLPGRLLKLNGTIPDEQMRHPTTRDKSKKPCLMVTKRGGATGLTIGRANEIRSYTRYRGRTSKEWAILPFKTEPLSSMPFSAKGDSGSAIVDNRGRIGGLLTGGTGDLESFDITYATPIDFLLKCMQEKGLREPNVNPVITT